MGNIINRDMRKLVMWLLTVKDKELSVYGVVFRWALLGVFVLLAAALAWRLVFL